MYVMVHGQHIMLSLPCPFHLGSTAGLAYNVVSHLLNIWRGTITREWCGKPGSVIITLSHSREGSKTTRFSLWQHNAGLSDWPLFPDRHLPPATLLLVLTSLLFLLSLLLCLPLPAVPAHTILSWGQFSAQNCGKTRERRLCSFPRATVVSVSWCGNTCPGAGLQAPRSKNTLFHKLWAHRVHVKPTQVQMHLKAFQICFPVVNLNIHLHIWLGRSQATRSALLRVTGLPL